MTRQGNSRLVVAVICVGLASWALCGCEAAAIGKDAIEGGELRVEGRVVEYVNVAFAEFARITPNAPRELRYYTFTFKEVGESASVGVEFNQEALMRELGYTFKGGGARFGLDGRTGKIREVVRFR